MTSEQCRPSRTRSGAAVAVSVLLAAVVLVPSATAAPSRDIDEVRDQVRTLHSHAESATERYLAAREALTDTQRTLGGLRRKVARESEQLRQVTASVEDLARASYMGGGVEVALQVLIADDPVEFLAQAATVDHVARSQSSSLRRSQTAGLRLVQARAAVADKEVIAEAYRDDMAAARSDAEARLAEAEDVLAGLEADEKARLDAAVAADRSTSLAQAQAALAESGPLAVSTRAEAAVRYALSRVGEPYSYDAHPPESWDCSKLTSAAWASAGIGLTPLSYTQWDQTQRVAVSDIQPGDLVFYFGSGAHHVAIYVGGGKMVSASNPTDGVELIDFLGPWYGERFSGVGRVIG